MKEGNDNFLIWDICEAITSKDSWYDKVNDAEIVAKWRNELSKHPKHYVDLALKLCRTSFQGKKDSDDCDHDSWCTDYDEWNSDEDEICMECVPILKNDIVANPKKYEHYYMHYYNTIDELFSTDDWYENFDGVVDKMCTHKTDKTPYKCNCIPPDSKLETFVKYNPNKIISDELESKIRSLVTRMCENEPVDWHPGSNNQVRDLVHPSMFCYFKGRTVHNDGTKTEEVDERDRYQWLPSEFRVDENGSIEISSYINNLKENYNDLQPMLCELFSKFLPSLEIVLNENLKDRNLQVITKIAQVILSQDNTKYPGGSWHIEGMPQEQIAATAIYYLDVDNITPSFLSFRKPIVFDEINLPYPQNGDRYTSHHYGLDGHYDGHMNKYLGCIKCAQGSSVVFPNTLQHRVDKFESINKSIQSLRTIIAFFVVDPNSRIISTCDVPKQQNIISLDEAKFHRERLMFHRKYFVDEMNEKVFESTPFVNINILKQNIYIANMYTLIPY